MSQLKNTTRNGKKWSVNETLRLQREYELLELSVDEIASLHQRTSEAIVFRLHKEGFIDELENARGYTPSSVRSNAKNEFMSYIDELLSDNRLTLEEIQTCFSEKVASLTKDTISTSSHKKKVPLGCKSLRKSYANK